MHDSAGGPIVTSAPMKTTAPVVRRFVAVCGLSLLGCSSVDILGTRSEADAAQGSQGGAGPGEAPPNILGERKGVSTSQINARVNDAFLQLFFGDQDSEAVFRDQGDGTGFIEDIANADVRTDSLGYGMLVTVQLDQRDVFDKLWRWAQAHMLSTEGPTWGLLNWRCDTAGENCDSYSATDSSSIIATALLIAEARWGVAPSGSYRADGLALLAAMTSVEERTGGAATPMNLFDVNEALPRAGSLGPVGEAPVDYLMPAFYDLWAQEDSERRDLWLAMAKNSRSVLARVSHPASGLLPERVTYDGVPVADHEDYAFTTSRTLFNLALDRSWNGPSSWISTQNERLLTFFLGQGLDQYVSTYTRDGEPTSTFNTTSHIALVAAAAGTSRLPEHDVFLEALLMAPIPEGTYRYYDGMFYMLSLLTLSGQMTPG